MKKVFAIALLSISLLACNNDPRAKLPATGSFGQSVVADTVKTVSDVLTLLETGNNIPVKVTGTIDKYCKGEGCWLTLENKGSEPLFVEVENKAFVLPLNIEGKIATVQGNAVKETKDGKEEVRIIASGIIIQ